MLRIVTLRSSSMYDKESNIFQSTPSFLSSLATTSLFRYLSLFHIDPSLCLINAHRFQYATSEEIFEERSLLYRIWYMTPLFFTFRMRFYSGFILSEVACIMAGLGAYPSESQPRPGNGPTALQHL